MLHERLSSLTRAPASAVVGLALGWLATLAVVDHATGPNLAVGVFYIPPVAVAAWAGGMRISLVVALVAAAAWGIADTTAGAKYSTWVIPVWNSATRLATFALIGILVASQRTLAERERGLAREDTLTGIGNARAFEERARIELDRIERFRQPLTVAYIDIDDFKRVNDTLGHHAGDELLRSIASICRRRQGGPTSSRGWEAMSSVSCSRTQLRRPRT